MFPRSDAGVRAVAFAQCARTIGPAPTHLLLTAEIVNERLAEARSIRYALSADLMLRFLMTPNHPVAKSPGRFDDQSVGDRDHDGNSIAGRRISEFLHGLFDRERAGPLARRKLLEARQMLGHDRLRWNDHKRMLNEPSHVVARFILRSLEGIGSQVEQFGQAQTASMARTRHRDHALSAPGIPPSTDHSAGQQGCRRQSSRKTRGRMMPDADSADAADADSPHMGEAAAEVAAAVEAA